jgi:hypothetical protein
MARVLRPIFVWTVAREASVQAERYGLVYRKRVELTMNTAYAASQTMTGAEVFGADGEKLGTVAAGYLGYMMVEQGFFFPTE